MLPVPEDVRHWHASPRSAVGFLLHAATMDLAALGWRRNLSMPGLSATVAEQIAALTRVAGQKAAALIRREPDPAIETIVAGWPRDFDTRRARELGFRAETDASTRSSASISRTNSAGQSDKALFDIPAHGTPSMPKFAANLSMMFTEHAFLDRFDAAAEAGFAAVEFLFPYEHPPEAIAERLERNRLDAGSLQPAARPLEEGERGLAALPGRFAEFKSGVDRALDYVAATGVGRVHMMAGNAARSDPEAEASYRRAIAYAAPVLADAASTSFSSRSTPATCRATFLNDFPYAARPHREPRPRQRQAPVRRLSPADHPRRRHDGVSGAAADRRPHPDRLRSLAPRARRRGAELPFLFAEFDRLGYDGYVGCEYNPRAGTVEGLGWHRPYRRT